jgi:hypothetical protein
MQSYGIKFGAVRWKSTDVSEEHIASRVELTLKMDVIFCIEASDDFGYTTRRYIREDSALKLQMFMNGDLRRNVKVSGLFRTSQRNSVPIGSSPVTARRIVQNKHESMNVCSRDWRYMVGGAESCKKVD